MRSFPGDDGLKYDYPTTQLLTIIWELSIYQFILIGMLIVMRLFRWFTNKKRATAAVSQESTQSTALLVPPAAPQNNQNTFDVFNLVSNILFYLIVILLSYMIALTGGFQSADRTYIVKVMAAVGNVVFGIILHFVWRILTADSIKGYFQGCSNIKGSRIMINFGILIVWITFVGLMSYALDGVCYCIYNDTYGSFANKFQISTQFTRRMEFERKICEDKKICHVYATLPENTDTSVFINIHTGKEVSQLRVQLISPKNETVESNKLYQFSPQIEEEYAQRKVWSVLFNTLQPYTMYKVNVITEFENYTVNYRTLTSFGDQNNSVRMIIGGDIGLTPEGRQMFDMMSGENPDVILLGGDITYDNAMTYCYYNWDTFYGFLDKVNRAQNRLIPFILALGNHDIGYNGLASVKREVNEKGPWWFAYHPQHIDSATNQDVPTIQNRKTYGYHLIGSTAFITLDSGYVESYQTQSQYLNETALYFNKQNYSLAAFYHVPLYPSCFHELPTHGQSEEALRLSHEFYEQTFIYYNFTVCLENHVHKFKRTNPINGVVYIGDGNIGVDETQCPKQYQRYDSVMAKTKYGDSNHYWVGNLSNKAISLTAVSRKNGTLDEFTLPLR